MIVKHTKLYKKLQKRQHNIMHLCYVCGTLRTQLSGCGVIQGANFGMITTSLPDMEAWTSSNTEEMSRIFIWSGLAFIAGTLLIGPLFDRVNGLLLLNICFVGSGVSIAFAPMSHRLVVFHALVALDSACGAAAYTGK